MKKAPNIYKLNDLARTVNSGVQAGTKDGRWIPARPLGYFGLVHRLKCAWLVFSGQADVVKWPGKQ